MCGNRRGSSERSTWAVLGYRNEIMWMKVTQPREVGEEEEVAAPVDKEEGRAVVCGVQWRGMMNEFGDTTSILDLLYPTVEKTKPCRAGNVLPYPSFI